MNPLKYAQMIKYLTRAKKADPSLPDVFPASKAPIPAKTQNVQETEAVNQIHKLRNPRVERHGRWWYVSATRFWWHKAGV
jgi:hypothetical protein